MSGGSMDYACFKVKEIADMEEDLVIKIQEFKEQGCTLFL